MINKNINFDSKKELKRLTVNKLFVLQKLELQNLEHYIVNNTLYDKNDVFNTLQEIQIINLVLTNKINSSNFKKLKI